MSPEPIAAALGGGLVAAAAVRTAITRVSIRRRLTAALDDPVPGTRVAAIQTIGENGVGRNARMLLAAAATEKDVWVRQALAQTVVRHRWEPATTKALVELRIWAKQELLWSCLEPTPDDRPTAIEAAAARPAGELEASASASARIAIEPADRDPVGNATEKSAETVAVPGQGWWER